MSKQIKPGQTWYHKTAHFAVKVEAANKREVLIMDKGLSHAATKGWQFIDRKEFKKYYEPNQ
jgi:hypothetical protein